MTVYRTKKLKERPRSNKGTVESIITITIIIIIIGRETDENDQQYSFLIY
jgi:hypothetical protein